jgi:hypothetical protein
VVPSAQLSAHVPAEHTLPTAQRSPQLPQFKGSLARSTHSSAQASKPSSQALVHTPSSQLATPFEGLGQRMPQPPQFSGSLVVSTQVPSQSSRPRSHA